MKGVMLGLATGAVVGAIAPILLPLPKPLVAGSFLLAMLQGGALAAVAKAHERTEKIEAAMHETMLQALREDMARQRTYQSLSGNAAAKMDVLQWASQNLPYEMQVVALAEFGLQPVQPRQVVTTTAREMPAVAPEPVRATTALAEPPRSGIAYRPPSAMQPAQPQSVLPVEDLARTYALMTRSGSTFRNVLMPVEPGTGKSTFVCALIHALNEVHQGHVDMTVFAGKLPDEKEDPGYCGLENSPEDYLFSGDYRTGLQVLKRLRSFTELTMQPAQDYPTILIQDEMNNTLDALKGYDKTPDAKIYGKAYDEALAINDMRLTQGRSRRIGDFITSHSAQVQDIGYNTTKQQAFDLIILGRYPMAMNSIRRSICAKFIPDEGDRARLLQDLQRFLDSPIEGVIALTNLGGNWRLVQLPDYRPYTRPIERGILNQSAEELADEFEEDLWEEPAQPTAPPDNQRLIAMLLDTIIQSGAFSMPKAQALGAIATQAREFWARHNKVITAETAADMAEYLWNLKDNGQLDSLTGAV